MFNLKNLLVVIITILLVYGCKKDEVEIQSNLADYIEQNEEVAFSDVVACAGGKLNGFLGLPTLPTDVIYYPIPGSSNIRYYEAENVVDPNDFSQYNLKSLASEDLFNGYLGKFNNTPFEEERVGVVTFETAGMLHVSNPIFLKTNNKPTEVNPDIIEVVENGVMPSFTWTDGLIDENAIYFHVISDLDNNLISGTYTVEQEFTFYDLSNVVFNITDPTTNPALEPDTDYKITLMGVSEDNWVNLFGEKLFSTN